MAAIAASDVTYTLVDQWSEPGNRVVHKAFVFKVVFGDGALTYPANGVPLTLAKLGCPNTVVNCSVIGVNSSTSTTGAGQVPVWSWNGSKSAPKIKGYEIEASQAGDAQLVELDTTDAPAAQELYLKVEGW